MVKNLPANAGGTGDSGLILGSGKSPGIGNGNQLQRQALLSAQSHQQRRLEGYSSRGHK